MLARPSARLLLILVRVFGWAHSLASLACRHRRTSTVSGARTASLPSPATQILQAFKSFDSPVQLFLMAVRSCGLGTDLPRIDTVVLLDSDWHPLLDLQVGAVGQVLTLPAIWRPRWLPLSGPPGVCCPCQGQDGPLVWSGRALPFGGWSRRETLVRVAAAWGVAASATCSGQRCVRLGGGPICLRALLAG